jgi:hypothetical protein
MLIVCQVAVIQNTMETRFTCGCSCLQARETDFDSSRSCALFVPANESGIQELSDECVDTGHDVRLLRAIENVWLFRMVEGTSHRFSVNEPHSGDVITYIAISLPECVGHTGSCRPSRARCRDRDCADSTGGRRV